MTSESEGSTEPWIEEHEAAYAYCYDKSGKFGRELGVTGLPTAVLVDPTGVIRWVGHPASLTESLVEEHLSGALPKPLFEWPKEAKKVRKAIEKRDLGKALEEAAKLDPEHSEYENIVRGLVTGRLASLKTARDDGDWLFVEQFGSELKKSFAGLPEQAEVVQILDALDADDAAKAILEAQEKVAKMFAKDYKRKHIEKMEEELREIVGEHPGTAAERDAKRGLKRLADEKKR